MTLQTLKSLRSDSNFKLFWENVIKLAEKENISEPEVPRRKRVPRRIDLVQLKVYLLQPQLYR